MLPPYYKFVVDKPVVMLIINETKPNRLERRRKIRRAKRDKALEGWDYEHS